MHIFTDSGKKGGTWQYQAVLPFSTYFTPGAVSALLCFGFASHQGHLCMKMQNDLKSSCWHTSRAFSHEFDFERTTRTTLTRDRQQFWDFDTEMNQIPIEDISSSIFILMGLSQQKKPNTSTSVNLGFVDLHDIRILSDDDEEQRKRGYFSARPNDYYKRF